MTRQFLIADLFCGAGGTSTGAEQAIREIGGEMLLVAVNHWPVAIESHRRNHPSARHYVEDVTVADPERIVPEGYLDLLMASPECRFFSRARGGRPVHDQARMNPWAVQRWLTSLEVRCLLVENVPEFVNWGPLCTLPDGHGGPHDSSPRATKGQCCRPDPLKRGIYFQAWLRAIWELGYQAEWRMLNSADYGDATTRVRFFLQARKDGVPIRWPEPTHAPAGAGEMFGAHPRWRAAREIIDWSCPGRSLLDDPKYRKTPLSEKTRRRIARGLERFGGPLAPFFINLLGLELEGEAGQHGPVPFVCANRNENAPRGLDQPVPVVTTRGGVMLVEPVAEPFLVGKQSSPALRSLNQPLPTLTTEGSPLLVDPVLTKYYGKSDGCSIEAPLPTVTARDRFGLVQPVIVPYRGERTGQVPRAHSVEEPLPAITTENGFALATPVLVEVNHAGSDDGETRCRSVDGPLSTITTKRSTALAEPVLVQFDQHGGNGIAARSVEDPLWTVVTKQNIALVEPLAVQFKEGPVDPRRLVLIDGQPYILDIRFRMLANRELARAMGFDDEETTYEFAGNVGEVTRQIGNAVPVRLAKALVKTMLEDGRG